MVNPLTTLYSVTSVARFGAAKRHVVIAGHGIGGTSLAKHLERLIRKKSLPMTVMVVGNTPNYTFKPLLPDNITGSVAHVPMSDVFLPASPVTFKQGDVQGLDTFQGRPVLIANNQPIAYDQLVLALGNANRMTQIPGARQWAVPLERPEDAQRIVSSVSRKLAVAAATEPTSAVYRHNTTFVIMGAGLSGIETAFALNARIKDVLKTLPEQAFPVLPKVILVHGSASLLSDAPESDRRYVHQRLKREGITVLVSHPVVDVESMGVRVLAHHKTPVFIETVDPIATLGGHPPAVIKTMNLPVESHSGRLKVDDHLQVLNHPDILAIGDNAAAVDFKTGHALPLLGQIAQQEGEYVAEQLAVPRHRQPPFVFRERGRFIATGPQDARMVINPWPLVLTGRLPAWVRQWVYRHKLKDAQE